MISAKKIIKVGQMNKVTEKEGAILSLVIEDEVCL